jgi:hypothetical protein
VLPGEFQVGVEYLSGQFVEAHRHLAWQAAVAFREDEKSLDQPFVVLVGA